MTNTIKAGKGERVAPESLRGIRDRSETLSQLDPPRPSKLEFVVLHYYRNSEIAQSLESNISITSLCGKRGPVGAGKGGAQEGARTVVCPLCTWVHSDLSKGRGSRTTTNGAN